MRELTEDESQDLVDAGLAGDVDDDAHLDGEDGFIVR